MTLVVAILLVVLAFAVATQYAFASDYVKTELTAQKDRKSTRLNSSHIQKSRMPSSA